MESIALDCLEPASSPSPVFLKENPQNLGKDIGHFKLVKIIAGPLDLELCFGKKWKCDQYPYIYIYREREREREIDIER